MALQIETTRLLEKLDYLRLSGDMADIIAIVGEGHNERRFKVHKLFLAMHSEVFKAKLYSSKATQKEITLADDSPEAFEILLSYVYTGKAAFITAKEAISVYHLAEKYAIPTLKEDCIKFLMNHISSDSVIAVYEMATRRKLHELRVVCWKHILQNTYEVIQGTDFINVEFSTVCSIILQPHLNVKTEVDLYNTLVTWGKANCKSLSEEANAINIRKKLEHLIPNIRFLAMTAEEFINGPGQEKILSKDEQMSIERNFIKLGITPLPPGFSGSQERRTFPSSVCPCCYFQKSLQVSSIEGFPTIIQTFISPYWELYIYGVSFYLSIHSTTFEEPESLECNLTIRNTSQESEISTTVKKLERHEEDCVIRTDEVCHVKTGETFQMKLEGVYHGKEQLYYCSGGCTSDALGATRDSSSEETGLFHFHGIFLWFMHTE